MVEFTLPRGSRPIEGKTWPKPQAATRTREFRIYRYDPEGGGNPRIDTYFVDLDDCGPMILDALLWIKNKVDPTLTFRRSCREGVCGSDAMNINGKNGLACLTNMNTLKGEIVLKPLPGLPVVRDLIVDMTLFFKQYHSIKPYLINDTVAPEKERLQSPEEREELNGLYECILCASCSTNGAASAPSSSGAWATMPATTGHCSASCSTHATSAAGSPCPPPASTKTRASKVDSSSPGKYGRLSDGNCCSHG